MRAEDHETVRGGDNETVRASTWLRRVLLPISLSPCLIVSAAPAAELPAPTRPFLEAHCYDCHDAETKKGSLDLTSLAYDPNNRDSVAKWIRIHDRVEHGEMPPPKKKERPPQEQVKSFLTGLDAQLTTDDLARITRDGRAQQRRLNSYEYENALRDLLHAPWLNVRGKLPNDGEAFGYNKASTALDLSHVQIARYMAVAEEAMGHMLARQLDVRPSSKLTRYYAREQRGLQRPDGVGKSDFGLRADRSVVPLLNLNLQMDVVNGKAPYSVGAANPEVREQEAYAQVSRGVGTFTPEWSGIRIPADGNYRLRLSGYTLTFAVEPENNWRKTDFKTISKGLRNEPVEVFAHTGELNSEVRRIGATADLTPEPGAHELGTVFLKRGEVLITDPMRFYRTFLPKPEKRNPLREGDTVPAVAFRWIEVEGPLLEENTDAGYRALFGDLPFKKVSANQSGYELPGSGAPRKGGGRRQAAYQESLTELPPQEGPRIEVISAQPKQDAERLMRAFMQQAYRRPVQDADVRGMVKLVEDELAKGSSFVASMIQGYTAVLTSPEFLYIEEPVGPLDDHALASRLAFFLWNSPPDATLRARAAKGELHQPNVLRAETERLLADAKSERFVSAFLDYWLDLRKRLDSPPSESLYLDYFLDDQLDESAFRESRLFFADLIQRDLPARNLVDSDFTYLNERLAKHYGIPGVEGIAMRRAPIPPDSPRGGFLTQAAVLKVTSNGTTTSPVLRGKWMNERIMGIEIPPPPPSVPAIEPDIRGATTLREQLAKHRADTSCAACHVKIDPPGFALESFDVMGAFRENYRALSNAKPPVPGFGYNGNPFSHHIGPVVDATGQFPDGTPFKDIHGFKQHLVKQEPAIARNLTRHLVTYATGAPVTYSDRAKVEQIIAASANKQYGLRTLIHGIVQSELFRNK